MINYTTMIKLICNRKSGTYNGIKPGQTINVQEENVNNYLVNGFSRVEEVKKQEEKKEKEQAKKQEETKKQEKAKKVKKNKQKKKQKKLDKEYKGEDKEDLENLNKELENI